jgi:DNA-3-methyladenine glycosylase II
METFTLIPRGPFSLADSIKFLEGFTPAAYARPADSALELAFPVEGSWQTAGVRVRQDDAGIVTAEVVSPAEPGPDLLTAVHAQVERILSLDVDGSGFPAVGERDPVAGEIQRRYPGLRPVGFWSPYEAAAWTIIGHRIRITQAAAIKARMAEQLGEPVGFGGRTVHAFPSPQRLAGLEEFRGLSGRKPEWLRSLARTALDGQLDTARLRAMPHEDAMADLKTLPGIGEFSAGLTLCAVRAIRTRCPARSRGWPTRWRSPTGCPDRRRPTRSGRSARTGVPTAPGSRCCCARSLNTRPARSPAALDMPGWVKLKTARGCA